jgi:serine/threonine-protein kinase
MRASDALVLPEDVLVFPVESLGPEMRARLETGAGDYVVSRPRSRGRSVVVDAAAAALLEQFRTPATVVEAILRHADSPGAEPLEMLDAALPLIVRMRRLGLLVLAGSSAGEPIRPGFEAGASVAGYTVVACVHLFEDVEVYRAGDAAGREVALKILRGAAPGAAARLEREAAVLRLLDGRHAPALVAKGKVDGRRWLTTAWCEGVDAAAAAAALREDPACSPRDVAALCSRILHAYASLHGRGVVHGDVHPGNLRVGTGSGVKILDFGLSSYGAGEPGGRGGIAEYMDPELAGSMAMGDTPPPPTERSEQYSLAALCFRLLTGAHHLDFRLERAVWLRQVLHEAPRSFEACGRDPWPGVEQVLARALSRAPVDRFASVREFAGALDRAVAAPSEPAGRPSAAERLLERVLQRYTPDLRVPGELLEPPRVSVNYGAAGLAYFFYRLASLHDDPELLAAADLWSCWARDNTGHADAFHSPALRITPERVGPLSLYHSASGVHWVQALVSLAMGDLHSAGSAVQRFVAACDGHEWSDPDLTVGRSGVLIGCAGLLEALAARSTEDRTLLLTFGRRTLAGIWRGLAREPVRGSERVGWTGIAHGWAGIVYAALRWREATGDEPPGAYERLDELAALSLSRGRTAAWPPRTTGGDGVARVGWCHGSAGHAHLWVLAHRLYEEERFFRLAVGAATHVWETWKSGARRNGSICCGHAGEAYALLGLYRHTGEAAWLLRARTLGEAAAASGRTELRGSLYKGDVGIALLAADLCDPGLSCTPVFEAESWRGSEETDPCVSS